MKWIQNESGKMIDHNGDERLQNGDKYVSEMDVEELAKKLWDGVKLLVLAKLMV